MIERKLALLLFSFVLILGCGRKVDYSSQGKSILSKTIIRDNDLIKVPENPNNHSSLLPSDFLNSIGRMEIGCTVTHIGDNLAITAGHCLAASSWYGDATFSFVKNISCNAISGRPLSFYDVSFGVRGASSGFLKGRCKKIVAAENNAFRDFAIIELDKAPVEKLPLKLSNRAIEGNEITIYSHPGKRPLEWSQECVLLDKRSDELNRIQYDCDTEGGSSGAAVLDKDTLDIVAIHTNGTPDTYFGHNSGTTMQDIISKLRTEFDY